MADKKKNQDKLLNIIRDTIKQDEELRKQLQIGDKFIFIRKSLQELMAELEKELIELKAQTEQRVVKVEKDDINVYVYLFNSQGLDVTSWRKMLSPDVYYEYSVSRPIYLKKEHVDKLIESKPTRTQHGYITIVVEKDKLLPVDESMQDTLGNQVVKVKEGAFAIDRVVSFTHNNVNYQVGAKGELVKKE